MKKIILFTLIILTCCAIIILSLYNESPGEELAYRMSKSENFKAIINFWKENSKPLSKLPDSTKNKFRLIKFHLDSLQKNDNLSIHQKADSILIIGKSEPILKRLIDSQKTTNLGQYYKEFNNEFPEFIKMPKQERSFVFKKAAAMWMKNSEL